MEQLYTRRGVMSIKNSPEGELFTRTLLFVQEGGRAEQRNDRCGCGIKMGRIGRVMEGPAFELSVMVGFLFFSI